MCATALVGSAARRKLAVWPGVTGDEVANMVRNRSAFDIAAGLNFGRDDRREVIRPMLKCVECDHANRVVKLASHEIVDDSFQVSSLDFGFPVDLAICAKAIHYDVGYLIGPIGHDGRSPA
jgi:hypothetical protein